MPYSSQRFVIVEDNDFIAHDLEAGLRVAWPSCEVLRLLRSHDACFLPDASDRSTVFITSERLSVIDDSGLPELARSQGAAIVVQPGFDTQAEVLARGFKVLATPFTDAGLVAFAERMRDEKVA